MSNTYPTGSAPCKAACPAHVPVQAYLRLARDGKYREALAMIKPKTRSRQYAAEFATSAARANAHAEN